jgi:glycosyltransferase involved in cell wall biosynthesis
MITVAISTYNHAKFLPTLLECCLKARKLIASVVVFDDCSTDATAEVLHKWQKKNPSLKFTRNDKNIGIGPTVALLMQQIETDDFLFIPSDDYFDPDKLAHLIAHKTNTGADVCYAKYSIDTGGKIQFFHHRGWAFRSYAGGRDEFPALFRNDMYMFPGATLFSRHLFQARPFYDTELDQVALYGSAKTFGAQDLRLALRLAQSNTVKFAFLNDTVSTFRRNEGQKTGDNYGISGRAAVEYAFLIDEMLSDASYPRLIDALRDMHGMLSHKCQLHEEHMERQGLLLSSEYLSQTRKGFAKLAKYID